MNVGVLKSPYSNSWPDRISLRNVACFGCQFNNCVQSHEVVCLAQPGFREGGMLVRERGGGVERKRTVAHENNRSQGTCILWWKCRCRSGVEV